MSIGYSLNIDANIGIEQVMELFSDGIGLVRSDENSLRGEAIFVVMIPTPSYNKSYIEDTFGFSPNLSIEFEFYSDEDEEEGERIAGKAIARLLKKTPGDAILQFNGERPVLRRQGKEVVVAEDWGDDALETSLAETGINYKQEKIEAVVS